MSLSAPREHRLPLEMAALGLLMPGPKHGYELYTAFLEYFGHIWRAGRSHFYAALKTAEAQGLVKSAIEWQETRPPRHILSLTPAGRLVFLEWVNAPSQHIRLIRIDFLAKLRFHQLLALEGTTALIESQLAVCEHILQNVATSSPEDSFGQLVTEFRRRQIQAVIDWLKVCLKEMETLTTWDRPWLR